MNKDFLKDVSLFKNDLINEELIKKYFDLNNLINKSFKLKSLKNKIKKIKSCEMNEKQSLRYNKLIKKYNSHPLVKEYLNVCDDVKILLDEIKMEIEN